MIMPVIDWVKRNKLSSFLILILVVLGHKVFYGDPFLPAPIRSLNSIGMVQDASPMAGYRKSSSGITVPSMMPIYGEAAPAPEMTNRMIVSNSQISLLVKDVISALASIKTKTASLGGYMVDSNLTRPEEAASGHITLRIPSEKLDDALSFLRSLSVKVVSENLLGEDVTDQFVDNEARLAILAENSNRFQEIMKKAEKIQDILQVQQEIFNIQAQMDSIKGQQNYLAKTAQMAKLTAYLSTDELALPYAPSSPWRPEAVFKLAVRSLLGSLQAVGSKVIWLAVYSVIWLPLLIALLVIYNLYNKKNKRLAKS
jgi:hypothetical protein